MFKGKQEKR